MSAASETAARPSYRAKRTGAASAKTATASVDLNTASAESLMRLPGIGKKRAEKILARRAKRPFRSTQELAAIKGIGPKLYKKLRPLIRVSEITPTSTAE
jgi:competence protein ComEA